MSNASPLGTTYSKTDVPGTVQNNLYRAFGDTFQVKRASRYADIKVDAWIEDQSNGYSQANIDLTRGGILAPNSLSAFTYLDHEDLFTLQPYFELELHPLPNLTITPGIKYGYFQRSLNARVNVVNGGAVGPPLKDRKAYGAPLPAVTVHYLINPNWAAYVQYAKGFQAPNLNYIQNADPSRSKVDPQQTPRRWTRPAARAAGPGPRRLRRQPAAGRPAQERRHGARIAAGLERAEAGRVRLRGMDVDGASARRFVSPERRALGMVFQEHALWPHLSARENVAVALPPGTARPGAAAAALLDAVEWAGLADRRPGTLSGGQQQRVALARPLATGSDLLLLDEPLSSLDGAVRDRLRPLIRDMLRRDGRAALFVSHDRVDAWRLADRILVLEHGALSQCDAPQVMYASPATDTAARCMGGEGRLRVGGADGGHAVMAGGCRVPATCVSLADGMAGMALAHPDGVGIGRDHGLPAIRRDCVSEAGLWRARWQVGCPGDELVGLHRTLPPERAALSVDPAKLFAFPVEKG